MAMKSLGIRRICKVVVSPCGTNKSVGFENRTVYRDSYGNLYIRNSGRSVKINGDGGVYIWESNQ